MNKTKVFVSFDFDNDKALKDFIIGQAKNLDSPFEVSDYSLNSSLVICHLLEVRLWILPARPSGGDP